MKMNINDINFAIEMLSHPQRGDESNIIVALGYALESLKTQRREIINRWPTTYKSIHKTGSENKNDRDTANLLENVEQKSCEDIGKISDGCHTFNELYHQRAVLFATIVNLNKDKAWKSFKHFDGKYCFDSNGDWFIVGIDTPEGSYTYHYSKEYWDMFNCEELECSKEWDGHTEKDVTRLLSLIESEE